MAGTTTTLIAYYLGLGFVIFLGWAAAVPDRRLDGPTARRYLRWTTVTAVVGLLHPALALGARDIVGQVGIEMPDDDPTLHRHQQRAARTTNAIAVVSAIPAAALVIATGLM
ncbi:MAG TPA: hypothetical protein VK611_04035 [Acidimicrobiales bacterium]|nr:hypothetical protein [Acidimicrobiales bacterium]